MEAGVKTIISYFNSIKVRLKLFATNRSKTITAFQFHKGTIKTPIDVVVKDLMDISIP